jgi:linker histone H1 and H5 family
MCFVCADDDFTGQIMNAIVACTEPKVSSARLLKQYITDYHPEFKVAERPKVFKNALERALTKNLIVLVFKLYLLMLVLA